MGRASGSEMMVATEPSREERGAGQWVEGAADDMDRWDTSLAGGDSAVAAAAVVCGVADPILCPWAVQAASPSSSS